MSNIKKDRDGYKRYFDDSVTHSLTPWSRVLLEKLTGLQLVKKFPTFYGTRRFITAFTIARHLSQLNPAHIPHILLLEDPS
jgi:hypothetical protein